MPLTFSEEDFEVAEPMTFSESDFEESKPPLTFSEADFDVPASAEIPLTPESFKEYQRTTPQVQDFSQMGDRAGQPDTEFTDALFNRLPTDVANVARAIPADLAAGLSLLKRPEGQEAGMWPSFGAVDTAIRKNLPAAAAASGNIPAALTGRPLPIDAALAESARESTQRGEPLAAETLGQVSQGLAATAPLLIGIGILPKAAQAFASAGFSLDMMRHAPEQFRDYAEEINKPKEEQDPDKLAQLQSGIIQTFAFAPLAGAHAGRGIAEKLSNARKIATELPANEIDLVPVNRELAAQAEPTTKSVPIDSKLTVEPKPSGPEFIKSESKVDLNALEDKLAKENDIPALEKMRDEATAEAAEIAKTEPTEQTMNAQAAVLTKRQNIIDAIKKKEATPLNPGGALKDLPPELQAKSNSVKDQMKAEFDKLKAAQAAKPELADRPNQPFPELTPDEQAKQQAQSRRLVEERYRFASPDVLAQKLSAFDKKYPTPATPKPDAVNNLVPAVKYKGETHIGQPGETHAKLINRVFENDPEAKVELQNMTPESEAARGFARDGTTEFIDRNTSAEMVGMKPKDGKRPVLYSEWLNELRAKANPAEPTSANALPGTTAAAEPRSRGSAVAAPDQAPIMANARLALDRPVKEPYSDTKHSVSLQVAATEFPADMRQSVKKSLPKELSDKIDSVQLLKGEVVPSNRGMSVPARVQITFKDKASAQSAIDYFKGTSTPGVSFFDPKSEALGLGRPSTRPTVEDVRRSREAGSPPPVEPPSRATPGTLSGNERMRKLSERATTSEAIPEPVQEQIKGSPESYYRQQSLNKVEDAVRSMSDAELGTVGKDSDVYTAAKLEQATRLFDSGNSEAGYRVFQDLSTELTRLGQVINQAKLFQALRPEHVVTVLNKELVKAGKDQLTPEQATRVKDLADARIKKQIELDRSTEAWTKNPTDASAIKAEKALEDANKAALDEQRLVNQFKPRSLPAILKAILQGNLLVPISHVANVVGNVNFTPFRSGVRTIASGIDILDSYLRNRPRQVSVSPIKGGKATVEGLIKGVKQIPAILAKGTGEVVKGETRAGMHPLRAWVKQFAKNPDLPTVGGKIPFSERVNLAIEGTFGVPSEVMLRGLGAGDIAFSEMARSRLIAEQSRLSKLSPGDAKMAKSFPELFFDRAALDKINNETRGAVFQRHSKTLDHMLSWIKGRGDWFDLAVAFVAPYKLTPWNIVGEILSYNPLIAMGRTALEAKRGNIRASEMNAAKVIVGSTLAYAGYWLYEKGMLSPSMDSKDEQQKARILAGEVMPPNHVNLSGLKRAMAGGDPAFKAGDETVDIFRGGGLAGSMFYMMANVGRDAETKPEAEQAILSLLKNSTLEQARFGLNQSFLKGVTGLLDAVREGEADTYAQSLAGTVLSVPLPNTLSAISRAERKYKVDATDKNLVKQVENTVRTRLGFAGMDDYLPLKRGLWGEPMRETPENRNALVYHFFDISKNRQVTSDPVPLELYRLWRKTSNTSVIPTPPDKTLTVGGETYLLNPEQRSRYAELIGTARRSIASQVVTNPEWHKIPDENKIDLLKKVYDNGLKIGKAQFFNESGSDLEKKPNKAGFGR